MIEETTTVKYPTVHENLRDFNVNISTAIQSYPPKQLKRDGKMEERDWMKDWVLTECPEDGCLDDSIYEFQDTMECQQVIALRYWLRKIHRLEKQIKKIIEGDKLNEHDWDLDFQLTAYPDDSCIEKDKYELVTALRYWMQQVKDIKDELAFLIQK